MKKFSLLLAFLLLAGCGDIKVVRNDAITSEPTFTSGGYKKSYKIGEKATTFIGDPIVRWQDSTIRYTKTAETFITNSDFELKGDYLKRDTFTSKIDIKLRKNVELFNIGSTNYKGTDYYVIAKDKEDNKYYFLVDHNGVLNKNVLIDDALDRKLISEKPYSSPDAIVFEKGPNKSESIATGGMSREIIFGGVNNITLNATYREYTPNDMARQAFYQSLVYQTTADTIRFRGFKIKVHEVTNEKITFTVLEDGLDDPKSGI